MHHTVCLPVPVLPSPHAPNNHTTLIHSLITNTTTNNKPINSWLADIDNPEAFERDEYALAGIPEAAPKVKRREEEEDDNRCVDIVVLCVSYELSMWEALVSKQRAARTLVLVSLFCPPACTLCPPLALLSSPHSFLNQLPLTLFSTNFLQPTFVNQQKTVRSCVRLRMRRLVPQPLMMLRAWRTTRTQMLCGTGRWRERALATTTQRQPQVSGVLPPWCYFCCPVCRGS